MNPQTDIISLRTDDDLKNIIDNREHYLPETVEAAVAGLQHRGHLFSDEELKIITEDIQAQRSNALMITAKTGMFNNEYKHAIVKDPAAPLLYSRRSIYAFSLFMGALFGSLMLAINISKTEKRDQAFWVVLFGIGFTIIQVFIITRLNHPGSSMNIFFGIVSAVSLDYFFWNRFIGYATFYRARAIWVPLVIAIILAAFIFLGVIYGGQQ